MPNEKNLQRLNKLLEAFDSGAVQHEELITAIDSVVEIIAQSANSLKNEIESSSNSANQDLQRLSQELSNTRDNLYAALNSTKNQSTSEVEAAKTALIKEIKRVQDLIPELPPEFDASSIWNSINEHRVTLQSLSTLILGENIRNALEALPEGEKLAISAIEGLEDELKKRLEQPQQTATALIARRLDQVGDVSISGVTNGQVLAYDATTKLWKPSSAGTGVVNTIVAGTGITVDDTDPANPIVSATGTGSGISEELAIAYAVSL